MMPDERGLRRFDARRGEHALLKGNQPCIEQQEIDRPISLDQFGEGGLNAGRLVQIELQRREDLFFGISRELRGRFLGTGQAATGDDDLPAALGGEQDGGGITEPGGGAGDESDWMFRGRLGGEGLRSSREALRGQGELANFERFGYIIGAIEFVKEF